MIYVTWDTETTGLNPYKGAKPFAYIYNLDGMQIHYLEPRVGDDILDFSLMLQSENYEKIGHNLKFDIAMVEKQGWQVNGPLHDTMIMAHVYNPDEYSKALKVLGKKYLSIEPAEEKAIKDWFRQNKVDKQYDKVPRELMEPYARQDVALTWKLFEFYREKGVLDDPIYKFEMRLLRVLISMQRRGILIDRDYLNGRLGYCDSRLVELEQCVQSDHGGINIASNKQLGEYLFDTCGLSCDAISVAGNPVLDESSLRRYDHPIVPIVLEARELSKLRDTYVCGLLNQSDDASVIHCEFNQVGAKTGRFSSREPNLQNIPRSHPTVDIRRAFICRPGCSLYFFDYSQIELRILAHYARDEKMLSILSEGGDLHGETARGIFGDDYTKEQRSISKNINFGIVYGIGPKHFCEVLNKDYPEQNYTYSDAKRFIDRYYWTYPMVRPFVYGVQRKILERGHVFDIFGRKYPCEKEFAYKAVNYLIQGCAAGVMKNAMVRVADYLKNKKSALILTIHDELVFDIADEEEAEVVPVIKSLMEDATTFRVPLTVSVSKSTTSWAEKTDVQINTVHPPPLAAVCLNQISGLDQPDDETDVSVPLQSS